MRKIEVNNEILLDNAAALIANGQKVTIAVKGQSMYPFLKQGEYVELLPPPAQLACFDLILAKVNGRYILHRLLKLEEDRVTMMGDGNLYCCEECKVNDVVAVVERGKYDLKYAQLWSRLTPFRRVLLFFIRRIIRY